MLSSGKQQRMQIPERSYSANHQPPSLFKSPQKCVRAPAARGLLVPLPGSVSGIIILSLPPRRGGPGGSTAPSSAAANSTASGGLCSPVAVTHARKREVFLGREVRGHPISCPPKLRSHTGVAFTPNPCPGRREV